MLKEIEQGGIVAWNFQDNQHHLFASATVTQDESGQYSVQIYKFDILDNNKKPQSIGKFIVPCPTRAMTWSTFGQEQGFTYGLIIIGLEDGSLQILDAKSMIETTEFSPLLYEEKDIFENLGPIECLEYNTQKPNLIALGGEEVLIMDITFEDNAISPILFSPDADNNPHDNSTVTAVSWNEKISHILASASQNGITVIWDLKTNKPIKSFGGDTFGNLKDVCLAWSPEFPTCVAKTEEGQKQQEIQIWDLRNPKGPIIILEKGVNGGHTAHISCISWCTTDTSLILTGSLDQTVICWSIKDKEPIGIEHFDEPIKSVNWSKINNLYSVTLQSGKVILKSLKNDVTDIAPPQWHTPVVGARFAPNGDIVYFHESSENIRIKKRGQGSAIDYFLDFDEFFEKLNEFQKLSDVCEWKLQELIKAGSTDNQLIWQLLKGIADKDNDYLIQSLGFSQRDIQKKAEHYTGKTHKKQFNDPNSKQEKNKSTQAETTNITQIDDKSAFDFFENMAEEAQKPPEPERKPNYQRLASSANNENEEIYQTETISRNINWDTGIEKIIKQNLLIFNFEGAIDSAMKCGRQAEALLIAYSQGPEVFENIMKDYFVSNTDPFIKNVVRNIVKKDNKEIASVYNLDQWKECACLFLSSVENQLEFQSLMNILAERFVNETKNLDNAILCYILAQNFEGICKIYYERAQQFPYNSLDRKVSEAKYLEVLIILSQILDLQQIQQQQNNHQYNIMLYESSRYLYEDNLILAAYSVLLEASDQFAKIAQFKDLLFNSNTEYLSQFYDQPPIPYRQKNIRIVQQPQGGNQGCLQKKPISGKPNLPFNQNRPTGGFANTGAQPFGNRPPVNNNTNNPPPVNNNQPPKANPPNPFGGRQQGPPPVTKKAVAPPVGQFNKAPPVAQQTNQPFGQMPPTNNNNSNSNNQFNQPPPVNNNNNVPPVNKQQVQPPKATQQQAPPPVVKPKQPVKNAPPKHIPGPPPGARNNQPPVNNNNKFAPPPAGGQVNNPPTTNPPMAPPVNRNPPPVAKQGFNAPPPVNRQPQQQQQQQQQVPPPSGGGFNPPPRNNNAMGQPPKSNLPPPPKRR